MSIASRITAITGHITDIYDTLELGGDTTENKNIININTEIKREYKNFLAHGVDVLWNNWEKVSGSGETLTLNNTMEGKMQIDLKGNTYQYSTSGKQVLDVNKLKNYTQVVRTETGLNLINAWASSIISNANLVATLKPSTQYTCKATIKYVSRPTTITENQNYTLLLFKTGTNIPVLTTNDKSTIALNTTKDYITTFTTPSDLSGLDILCYTYRGKNSEGDTAAAIGELDITNLMIVEGRYTLSNFPEYEPYTNGASPNPDYPQDIQVVSGDNTIKVEGKNLFDLSTLFKNKFGGNTTSDKGITFTNNNGTINLNGTSTGTAECIIGAWNGPTPLIELDSSQTYTLKIFGKEKSGNTVVCGVDIRGIKNGSASKIIYGSDNNDTIELTGWSSIVYIDIYTQYTSGAINKNISIQLVKGSTIPTTYTPYVSQTYPISLGNIELCKIGTYQDKIYKDNGKWYLRKAVEKVDLGDLTWTLQTWGYQASADLTNIVKPANTNTIANILCNVYIACTPNNAYGLSGNIEHGISLYGSNIMVRETTITSLNDFNDMISSAYAYLVLATPTYEEITDTTLLSQLEALAYSYDGTTNISQENDDLASELDVVALQEM